MYMYSYIVIYRWKSASFFDFFFSFFLDVAYVGCHDWCLEIEEEEGGGLWVEVSPSSPNNNRKKAKRIWS
jgi:hypothetical protein